MAIPATPSHGTTEPPAVLRHHFRFHAPHAHLAPVFGSDWFGVKAEVFARFFGTPLFLVAQTIIVAIWIVLNMVGVTHFDLYPFILLNLAFSLQAAYAAPLILLAQTRQADRDKVHTEADTMHREALAAASAGHAAGRADHGAAAAEHRADAAHPGTQSTDRGAHRRGAPQACA